jgi:protein O-mannosyl-transferase
MAGANRRYTAFLYLAVILLITILVYSNSLQSDFIYQFDDDLYVTNNADIKSINSENLYRIFSKSYVGLYLPLTMLTLMADYAIYELNPTGYHVTNLLMHLISTVLVFFLISKIKPNHYIAGLAAIIFAIHPMHVESVTWISERKDVLYSLFYLAGLITYINYTRKQSSKNYLLTLLFFILSLLSKTVAVSFPLFLTAFDWYRGRKIFDFKVILEKVPFYSLSLFFGLLGIYFTSTANDYTTPDIAWAFRPFIISDAIMIYLTKFFAPFNLMIYYYYPDISEGVLPIRFYVSFGILLIIVSGLVIWVLKAGKMKRDLLLGLLFFAIPTFFVLQIIPAGRAYAAERYTYLSYIGITYIIGIFTAGRIETLIKKKTPIKNTLIGLFLLFVIGFAYLTYDRNEDWKDSLTLFTDLIEKNPNHGHPYLIRGITHVQFGNLQEALDDYNESIRLHPDDPKTWSNRSSVRGMLGDIEGALDDANRSLEIRPGYSNGLNNRATAYFFSNQFEKALADYDAMMNNDPDNKDLLRKRIAVNEKLDNPAGQLDDYLTLVKLEPENYLNYAKVGELYYRLNDDENAIIYLTQCMQIRPAYHQPLMLRGNSQFRLGNYEAAAMDFRRSAEITNQSGAWYNAGQSYLRLNQLEKACPAWQKALETGHPDAIGMLQKYCK